jgi:hypothetical protein
MNRADLAGRIDVVEHRMDSIEQRLDASFAALSAQVVQSHRETRDESAVTLCDECLALLEDRNRCFDRLDAALAENRRLMLVLHEEVMSQLALLEERLRN